MPAVHRRPITEHAIDGRRLGRHVYHDPKSRKYPAETASKLKSVVHQAVGLPLNQALVGKCTAEALAGALNSKPNFQGRTFTDTDTDQLYAAETKLEGHPWSPAHPTINDIGGSGLIVCKAAKALGWVKSYRHAFGLDHALAALVLRPVIFGVNWYSGFDSPDPKTGIVKIGGKIRGGHEICADEIDVVRELVGYWQSWNGWGLNRSGRFYIPFADVGRLLQEEGDATVPTV